MRTCDSMSTVRMSLSISHRASRKGSTSNRTEPEHKLNGSWINAHGFASACYFCCWTPLNLFNLEVTDHPPRWEQNSSMWRDLCKNLSYNGQERKRNLVRYIYVPVSKDQVYRITELHQYMSLAKDEKIVKKCLLCHAVHPVHLHDNVHPFSSTHL